MRKKKTLQEPKIKKLDGRTGKVNNRTDTGGGFHIHEIFGYDIIVINVTGEKLNNRKRTDAITKADGRHPGENTHAGTLQDVEKEEPRRGKCYTV